MITNKISIAIPVYERVDFFEDALNSALTQTTKCPVYIVDNASSHNKFQEIIEKKHDFMITYIRNEKNVGMVGNWNRCIEVCQTEYLSILHDDDVLHSNYIENCLDILKKYPSQKYCYSVSTISGTNPSILLQQKIKKERYINFKTKYFMYRNLTAFPGVLFPVSVANTIGGFDESEYPSADYHFWMRLSKNIAIVKSNLPYAFYRVSDQQDTTKCFGDMLCKIYERRKILLSKRKYASYFISMWKLYANYLSYCEKYGEKIDVKNSHLYKWLKFFRKIDTRVFRIFCICYCKLIFYINRVPNF